MSSPPLGLAPEFRWVSVEAWRKLTLASTNRSRTPGSWAALAHLPSILNSPNYQLVALANSTVESAKKSIEFHNLPPETRAYGNAADLAQDDEVDLVVVSVNVQKRPNLVKPALLAGKDVFVEWPLGANSQEAREFASLAEAHDSKTIVGLQARADPLVLKTREILSSGKIGRLTSSSVLGCFSPLSTNIWIRGAEYYLDMESGGNAFTIFFGHFLDTFTSVLGNFANVQSILKTQYPTTNIVDSEGKVVQANHPKTAPDHILVQGVLEGGAVASLSFRSVPSAVDHIGFRWLISGTKGEIEVTAPELGWQLRSPEATLKIRVGKKIETVNLSADPTSTAVPFPGTNTAGLYDAFAKGDISHYSTFGDAVKTHHLLDRIVQASRLPP